MNNDPAPHISLRTPENQRIMEEWACKENRPRWVDVLAFKILEEFVYEDADLKIGGLGSADPVDTARYLMKQE